MPDGRHARRLDARSPAAAARAPTASLVEVADLSRARARSTATTWSSTPTAARTSATSASTSTPASSRARATHRSRSSPTAPRAIAADEMRVPERHGDHARRPHAARRREHGRPPHRVRRSQPDGTLSNRRVWAQLDGATARRHLPRRRRRDLDRVPAHRSRASASPKAARSSTRSRPHAGAFACMLGGDDRRTLYVCTLRACARRDTCRAAPGRIEARRRSTFPARTAVTPPVGSIAQETRGAFADASPGRGTKRGIECRRRPISHTCFAEPASAAPRPRSRRSPRSRSTTTVDQLLDFSGAPADAAARVPHRRRRRRLGEGVQAPAVVARPHGDDARTPLQEKLTLFWHGHFATANYKVTDMLLMYQQNALFRLDGRGQLPRPRAADVAPARDAASGSTTTRTSKGSRTRTSPAS